MHIAIVTEHTTYKDEKGFLPETDALPRRWSTGKMVSALNFTLMAHIGIGPLQIICFFPQGKISLLLSLPAPSSEGAFKEGCQRRM